MTALHEYAAGISPDDLRRRREALGLTQDDLARIFGVTNTTVSRWERGITPMPGRLVELAMAHLTCAHAAAEG